MKARIQTHWLATLGLGLLLSAMTPSVYGAGPAAGESFHYRWRLTRFLGVIAGLFLPREGDGVLSLSAATGSALRSELRITAASAGKDFYLYASELDPQTGRAKHAWSEYSWRGETSSKQGQIESEGVIDVASGIYLLRQSPPDQPRPMEIWSDGKIYPVIVVPVGNERRQIAGKLVETRHLSIRGVEKPGRRFWKAKLDLWLAKDEIATPVEIRLDRRGAALHLEMVSW